MVSTSHLAADEDVRVQQPVVCRVKLAVDNPVEPLPDVLQQHDMRQYQILAVQYINLQ